MVPIISPSFIHSDVLNHDLHFLALGFLSSVPPAQSVAFLFRILVTLRCALFVAHWVGVGFARLLSRNKEAEPVGRGKGGQPKQTTYVVD